MPDVMRIDCRRHGARRVLPRYRQRLGDQNPERRGTDSRHQQRGHPQGLGLHQCFDGPGAAGGREGLVAHRAIDDDLVLLRRPGLVANANLMAASGDLPEVQRQTVARIGERPDESVALITGDIVANSDADPRARLCLHTLRC